MTFPQPPSQDALLNPLSNEFRLRTQLLSNGDLFESEVSAAAFVIGPDSDVSSIQVSYYDPLARYYTNDAGLPVAETSRMSSQIVSVERALVGSFAARMDTDYPQMPGRKGRILLSNANTYLPGWLDAVDGEAARYLRIPPVFDVIQYFQQRPSLTSQRADKTYDFQYTLTDPAGTPTFIVIPAWGRKSGFFTFLNRTGSAQDVRVDGVTYSTSNSPGVVGSRQEVLFTAAALANNATTSYQYDQSADGAFDAIVIRISAWDLNEAFPISVLLSDDPL